MLTISRVTNLLAALLVTLPISAATQTARISEETRALTTYPFYEPNPIPILTRDSRLYPYHSFEGYTNHPVEREWKVVHLENDLIEVFVLPEVGGKVWGAVVKETGHEFIYRNEVMKFRNIALRGPWTSGGIELNFGVIGHTPATATPVDYLTRENPDGSVSCLVGTMDLPSRTQWRVEIRLPADRAYFETNVLWYNPTPLEQPYYNWMTAAAFARNDLEMFMPGNRYLAHSGDARPWPVDSENRYLPAYANNTFGGHKSYHVVGELHDFFGGYYHDEDYGFGHWSRYEDMPGQKLWLWALSREGGVWEDLLTDTDGQYVEFQAGRLFVQYSPGSDVNPITQVGFGPGTADRWTETWFPVEGIGGLTEASREGVMSVGVGVGSGELGVGSSESGISSGELGISSGESGVESGESGVVHGELGGGSREQRAARGEADDDSDRETDRLTVRAHAFGNIADTLRVYVGERQIAAEPIEFVALEAEERVFEIPAGSDYRVELPRLGLDYSSDPTVRELARPFETDPTAQQQIPEVDLLVFEAAELLKARRYKDAGELYEQALDQEPWHRDALLGMANLQYRRALYDSGLEYANRLLQLDAYDAKANFLAGNLYRALGQGTDARDAYGWAARSMEFRSAAYVQLAELAFLAGAHDESERYARFALDYDRFNIPALEMLALIGRRSGDTVLASSMREQISDIDPLNHFTNAELFLSEPGSSGAVLGRSFRSEYPGQTILELAVGYARLGERDDAIRLLRLGVGLSGNPIFRAWLAWLNDDPSGLATQVDVAFVFPYRAETLPVLAWAAEHDDHWSWDYLLALNLWALDREEEAAAVLVGLGDTPAFAPAYVARASLLEGVSGTDQEPDLRRAVELDRNNRTIRIQLVRYLEDRGRWDEALVAVEEARSLFPEDFNLDLLHVRALNNLGRPLESIDILANTHVLPSENARQSHRLYVQAHTLAALDAIDNGSFHPARRHLHAALDWPENLGQGRPYEPEERRVRLLLGQVETELGNRERARDEFGAVLAQTNRNRVLTDRRDLLVIPALAVLGQNAELEDLVFDSESNLGRFAAELISVIQNGADYGASLTRLAVAHSELFDDLEGSLLLRALLAAE